MRLGLVSYLFENRNTAFNMSQIGKAMERMKGKADLLCFGEAFLQGFDSLCWDYEADREIAVELSSKEISQLRRWTLQYGMSLITGYIEKAEDKLYSSCIVISDGEIVHNYRRISKGWKEYSKTDSHYCEGTETGPFELYGKSITIALCGDLWDYPERFTTQHLLIWPVYVDFSVEEWENNELDEYAAQADFAAGNVLMVNSLSSDPVSHGGSFHFRDGQTAAKIPFDHEGILIVDI